MATLLKFVFVCFVLIGILQFSVGNPRITSQADENNVEEDLEIVNTALKKATNHLEEMILMMHNYLKNATITQQDEYLIKELKKLIGKFEDL